MYVEGQSEDPGEHENGMNEDLNPGVSSDSRDEAAQPEEDDNQIQPTEDDPGDDARDVTPTRDEEGDAGSAEQYYDDEYDQPPLEEDAEGYEDVAEYDGAHDEYEEDAGNDFQHEEDNPEYRVEEETEEEEYRDAPEEQEGEMMAVEEMAEQEESGAGDAVEEEEEDNYNEVDETGIASTENLGEEGDAEDPEHESPHEDIPTETESEKPVEFVITGVEQAEYDKPESQVKAEQGGKEEVVSSEVDVLDMLDYDLEIPGEPNNINAQQGDQSMKNNTGKTMKADSTTNNAEESSASDDHKAHPKPVSSKPSSMGSARAGSPSSPKRFVSGKSCT